MERKNEVYVFTENTVCVGAMSPVLVTQFAHANMPHKTLGSMINIMHSVRGLLYPDRCPFESVTLEYTSTVFLAPIGSWISRDFLMSRCLENWCLP